MSRVHPTCSCSVGDSGGPLIQYDTDGKPVLVGIAIAVILCGSAGYPSLYTRITGFMDFLPTEGVVLTDQLSPVLFPESTPVVNPEISSPYPQSTPAQSENGTSDRSIQSTILLVILVVASAVIIVVVTAIVAYKVSRRNTLQ